MEDKIPKQPVKDHHGFFTVVLDDKPDRRMELEDQHKNEQNDSEE
jgi:hypothetical protein